MREQRSQRAVGFERLVPSSLLPPEDPSQSPHRTVRDWIVDTAGIVLAAVGGLVLLSGSLSEATGDVSRLKLVVDCAGGGLACLALLARRSHPTHVGFLTAMLSAVSTSADAASAIGLFTVAVHRRFSTVVGVAVVLQSASALFALLRPQETSWLGTQAYSAAAITIVTASGMFVRARRQLVWTLRERASRAEAEQWALAEHARTAERTRIAREMHDVLAHRISLLALHAGGLELRPDLPPDKVGQTAALLRTTAGQALEELRAVIGLLRNGDQPDAPAAPQPTLEDIVKLVDESQRAGAKIQFSMSVTDPGSAPDALGRDAYRVVQEALTNVAKHAQGTATTVRISGGPDVGLNIDIRNRLPLVPPRTTLPGSGVGLIGLRERVELAGGTLTHGPTDQDEFLVEARLRWP